MTEVEQFRDAIRSAGLEPPDVIEANGKLRRFASNGKRGDDAGWYVLYGDGIPAGAFGDWRTGISETWRANIGRTLTPDEETAQRARMETLRREREADEIRHKAETATKAAAIWKAAQPAPEDHPYLNRKSIKAHGARLHDSALVIPMRDGNELYSLQFIGPDGEKRFLTGGRVTGCYFSIGAVKESPTLCIAEGFATGATIHEATGHPVAVAFNAGNLKPVALALRKKFPELRLILCADDDATTASNPGVTKATEAARSVGGLLAIPDFGTDRPEGATDFNDMAALGGMGAVARAITGASKTTGPAGNFNSRDWSEPLPLMTKVKPEPYPLDALPDKIRAAVVEVQGFTKAPIPLVASSALGALSLSMQAHADVRRDEILVGPVGLFLLTIADSGERKTQSDKMFLQSIVDYQDEQREAAKADWEEYRSKMTAWEAKRAGVMDAIRQAAKKGDNASELEATFSAIDREKPKAKRFPKLIREDATPEGLAKKLQNEWPSAGVICNEAGIVFGAHGMGKDSVMRNLSLLNKLYDGGRYQSDRGDENRDRDVRGARLTMGLMVQEMMLRAFFDQSKGLARGSGFLARFLVAWPDSTMGTRFYTDPAKGSPALAAFNRRIAAILNQPAPIDDDGVLSPPVLPLAPDAKDAWVTFHDAIEAELTSGGELYDVRDVASKSADNAARLAALFQAFEHGISSTVGPEAFEGASRIVAWHLNESRRFFGELALPADLVNAARLDSWLIEYCRRKRTNIVPTKKLQQFGPGGLREKTAIESAMRELEELNRARLARDGRRRIIEVNPALVIEGGEA
jgi:putative DNA primase/helicase